MTGRQALLGNSTNAAEEGLDLGEETLSEMMSNGYATATFSKWHLGYKTQELPPTPRLR